LVIFVTSPPDLLVARDGETVAVRSFDNRLYLVRRPADEYSATEWLKRDGDGRTAVLAEADAAHGVRCDAYGCVAHTRDNVLVAMTLRRDALAEDCAAAAVVISAVPVRRRCPGPKLVIDRFDVSRNGAYAIWLGERIRVETVQGSRGERPWSAVPRYARARKPGFNNGG
jgi:competence protein ComEC